jgi:hypothetical protein
MQIKKPRGSMMWCCMIHIAISFVNSELRDGIAEGERNVSWDEKQN